MKSRKFSLSILFLLLAFFLQAQQRKDCGTTLPVKKPVITTEQLRQKQEQILQFSTPYPVRVFIRVFAGDDGNNLSATEADVLRQFENMRNFYSAHDICFILAGYEVINNSDLNWLYTGNADKRAQLAGLAINGCMNIFIHQYLSDDNGELNGIAYDIPSHILSMASWAISSTSNLSTMAHEMGHCLGLLHTFEDAYGAEAVARSGSCMDCEDEGDLICDTNADRNVDENVINANCEYTGTLKDECDASYLMEENNIMTYGQRSCRDRFTNGQGARARTYLLSDHGNRIAEDVLTVLEDPNLTGGLHIYASRSLINISAPGFTVSQTANVNLSSREVVLSPGVDLKPTSGYIAVRAGTYCQ